jgi:hypothetical protein
MAIKRYVLPREAVSSDLIFALGAIYKCATVQQTICRSRALTRVKPHAQWLFEIDLPNTHANTLSNLPHCLELYIDYSSFTSHVLSR